MLGTMPFQAPPRSDAPHLSADLARREMERARLRETDAATTEQRQSEILARTAAFETEVERFDADGDIPRNICRKMAPATIEYVASVAALSDRSTMPCTEPVWSQMLRCSEGGDTDLACLAHHAAIALKTHEKAGDTTVAGQIQQQRKTVKLWDEWLDATSTTIDREQGKVARILQERDRYAAAAAQWRKYSTPLGLGFILPPIVSLVAFDSLPHNSPACMALVALGAVGALTSLAILTVRGYHEHSAEKAEARCNEEAVEPHFRALSLQGRFGLAEQQRHEAQNRLDVMLMADALDEGKAAPVVAVEGGQVALGRIHVERHQSDQAQSAPGGP